MTKRDNQKAKRRQEILAVALDLFIRRGYTATKINDIAKAVPMSTGLLFHYFPSKEALYQCLIEMGVSGPKTMMGMLDNTSPIVFFEKACEQIFALINSDPFVAKMFVLMNHAQHNEAMPIVIKDMLKEQYNYYDSVPLIIKGQEQGTIKQGDPLSLAVAFWSAISGIAETIALHNVPCPQSEWIVSIIRR